MVINDDSPHYYSYHGISRGKRIEWFIRYQTWEIQKLSFN